ncbi:MAG: GNAT family protein [Patescibacteria group bacterium]
MARSNTIVSTFTTKTGQKASIRYAQADDAADLTEFINTFSLEDSFTRFSGEQLTLQEEVEYLQSEVQKMKDGDAVKLFCYSNAKLAGVCDIHRDTSLLTRRRHAGILGLIVSEKFRGQGIGERLVHATMAEANRIISGLRMITLTCFATNDPAITLYKKLGFSEVGRIPNMLLHKKKYVDEIIMIKNLDSK